MSLELLYYTTCISILSIGVYHFSKEIFRYFYNYYYTKKIKNKIKEEYLIKVFLVNSFYIAILLFLDKMFIGFFIEKVFN
jgi:hypothetical protein